MIQLYIIHLSAFNVYTCLKLCVQIIVHVWIYDISKDNYVYNREVF